MEKQRVETPNIVPTVEMPHFYVVEENKNRLTIEEDSLARNLTNYLLRGWVNDLLSNSNRYYRIHAALKLAQWGSGLYIQSVLRYTVENDADSRVQKAASSALEKCKANEC